MLLKPFFLFFSVFLVYRSNISVTFINHDYLMYLLGRYLTTVHVYVDIFGEISEMHRKMIL